MPFVRFGGKMAICGFIYNDTNNLLIKQKYNMKNKYGSYKITVNPSVRWHCLSEQLLKGTEEGMHEPSPPPFSDFISTCGMAIFTVDRYL